MAESSILGLIGLIGYIIIFILVLVFIISRVDKDTRNFIISLSAILVSVAIVIIISIPILQLSLFIIINLLGYYITRHYILPNLFTRTDKAALFAEIKDEVWNDLKVNKTIIEKKET